MKRYVSLVVMFVIILLAGCATSQNRPSYVWQDYSSSLYSLKKTPTDTNLKNHKEVLLAIMEESKSKSCRVPPGVYCEYGYLLLKDGKKEEALRYFDLEEQAYPESKVFIQNLKAYATRTAKKDEAAKTNDSMPKDASKNVDDKAVNTNGK